MQQAIQQPVIRSRVTILVPRLVRGATVVPGYARNEDLPEPIRHRRQEADKHRE